MCNETVLALRDKIDFTIKSDAQGQRLYWALRRVLGEVSKENPAPISPAFGDGWRTAMATVIAAIESELG